MTSSLASLAVEAGPKLRPNFPEKNIAGIKSQFLLLGSIDEEGKVTLLHPSQKAENGLPIA